MSYYQVQRSPINFSKAKQLYSFGKSQRFQRTPQSPCKQSFYETKRSAFSNHGTSLGYGNKQTFQNRQSNPSPTNYKFTNQFETNVIKRRGHSFGQQQKKGPVDQKYARFVPGPGTYRDKKQQFSSLSYSMRSKYNDPLDSHGNQLGPGQYSIIPGINQDGKYFLGKYQNSGASKIGRDRRFVQQKPKTPGPGKYFGDERMAINPHGTYYSSKFRTTNAGVFGRSSRHDPLQGKYAPGPGSYQTFSEFAYINKSTYR